MLRKYWFYSLSLLHAIFDLLQLGAVLFVVIWRLVHRGSGNWGYTGLSLLYWFLSSTNSIFLSTYGFIYTNTIFGTFLFQQAIRFCLMLLYAALAIWAYFTYYFFPSPFNNVFILTSASMHAAIWISLWVLFVVARFSGHPLLGQWKVNVEDLASRAQPLARKVTLRGIPRPNGKRLRRVRALRATKKFVINAVFRRVHPVETRIYAFGQHLFAVGAIALLLTRIIISLAQLGNEKLPSRAMVGPCGSSPDDDISVLVRHPSQSRLLKDQVPDANNLAFRVSVALRADEFTNLYNGTSDQCFGQMIKTNQPDLDWGSVDWFWLYTCNITTTWRLRPGYSGRSPYNHIGFEYTMSARVGSGDGVAYDLPSIWLVRGLQSPNLLVPYLAPALIPTPNAHTVHSTHFSQRKFISTPPLRDAITGSKPGFNVIDLYPASPVYSKPITSNSTIYSSGFIRWPNYLFSSLQTPRSDLTQGLRGPDDLCEVIEEYRIGNTFDILASIGGLFALLQGLHMFLFGRPLFWGLFGAKLLTPFGLVGQFATTGFRKRLREYYCIPDSINASAGEGCMEQSYNNMRMTQFLLDYVLDMGPAFPINRNTDEKDLESLYEEAQLNDMDKTLAPLSQDSNKTDMYSQVKSFLPPIGRHQRWNSNISGSELST